MNENEIQSDNSTMNVPGNLNTPQPNPQGSESARGSSGRRGFLGQVTTMLAAGVAGVWSLASPGRGNALSGSSNSPAGIFHKDICMEPCGGPPPPPPNYTTESEALVNKVIAAFNAHNASELVSYMDSATIDTADLQTHLQNNFTAFPKVAISVSSMTAGAYGYSVTIDWTITGEYQVVVTDSLVDSNGVNPTQSDVITGSTTFLISAGSIIYDMDTTHNIVPIFAAHGATVL
ncbi:MAG: hypothetical protein WBC78_14880 [Candidatus Sulfotelmatobacter sp.]